MDFRDRVIWTELARKKLAETQLAQIAVQSLPYADEAFRSQYIDALVEAAEDREPKTAEEIEAEKQAEYRANIEALGARGGGKRRKKRG